MKNYNVTEPGEKTLLRYMGWTLGIFFGTFAFFLLLANLLVPIISLETEARWFPVSEEDWGEENPKQTAVVQDILNGIRGEIPAEVVVYCDDEINAFASFGGKIMIPSEVIRELGSENELSFLLAHELSHIRHRDPLRSLISKSPLLILDSVFGIQLSSITDITYGKAIETRADREAAEAIVQKYGHAGGIDHFFEVLQNEPWVEWFTLFSDHPQTASRIAAVKKNTKNMEIKSVIPLEKEIFEKCQ